MVALLMSYPRSGNHMVRAFLEAASGRPTLGCRANPIDTPIRDRFADDAEAPFERLSEDPVAHKIHWISEELSLRRDGYIADRMCLVVRDPARCIVSQLIRSLDDLGSLDRWKALKKLRKPAHLERAVLSELEQWYVLTDHYLASDLPKIVVGFEDLLSKDGLSIVNDQILPFFDISDRFTDEDHLRRIAAYGRESQRSNVKELPEAVYDSNAGAAKIVRSAVDYGEIRARLGLPPAELS